MKQHFKVIPTSHLFLIRDSKIFLMRRFNTGFADGMYSVPAGHFDGNETASQAMIREAKEETGINVTNMKTVHVMSRKSDEERIDFFFIADSWKGEPKNMEPHKCDHAGWFSLDNLPENVVPYVRKAIENAQKNVFYSEFGW